MAQIESIQQTRRRYLVRLTAFIGVLLALAAGLFWINNLLVSVILAVIIAYLANPFVDYLEGRGATRLVSIVTVFSVFTAVFVSLIVIFVPMLIKQAAGLQNDINRYIDGTIAILQNLESHISAITGGALQGSMTDKARNWLVSESSVWLQDIPRIVSSSLSVLVLSPLLGFLLLLDGRRFSRQLLNLVPNNFFELTLNLQHQINQQIGEYIRARLLESIIVGAVILIGLLALGVKFAVLLAAFAAVANLIPYIGPLFGAAPAIIVAMVNQESGLTMLLLLGVFVLAQVIDTLFIIPLLVARVVDLHPLTVILVVILGAQLMGILGMLISIPVASAAKVTFASVYKHLTEFT